MNQKAVKEVIKILTKIAESPKSDSMWMRAQAIKALEILKKLL